MRLAGFTNTFLGNQSRGSGHGQDSTTGSVDIGVRCNNKVNIQHAKYFFTGILPVYGLVFCPEEHKYTIADQSECNCSHQEGTI